MVSACVLTTAMALPVYADTIYRFYDGASGEYTEVSKEELNSLEKSAQEYANENGLTYVSDGGKNGKNTGNKSGSGGPGISVAETTVQETNAVVVIPKITNPSQENSTDTSEKQTKDSRENKGTKEDTEKKQSDRIPEAKQETASPENEKKAEISHGIYPGLTDTALDAFTALTMNDIKDDCYINVSDSALDKTMPGNVIAYTKAGEEDGTIQFVNDNKELVYSVRFPQVAPPEGSSIDLSMTQETDGNNIHLHFAHPSDEGFSMILRFQTGMPNQDFYIFDETGKELQAAHSDNRGYAAMQVTALKDMTVTTNENYSANPLTKSEDVNTGTSYQNEYSYSGNNKAAKITAETKNDAPGGASDMKSAADGKEYKMPETFSAKETVVKKKIPVLPVVLTVTAAAAAAFGIFWYFHKFW